MAGIVVVTSGFPRRSETFLLNELLALDAAGALAGAFATKPGEPGPAQPDAERLARRVCVLPQGSTATQAAALVERLDGTPVRAVHAYFAHAPAAVAQAAASLLGVPFGFSVHARDARKVAPEAFAERCRAAACVVACNADVAAEVRRAGREPALIPHGVDLARFAPVPARAGTHIRVLAVGRLVAKKGFDVLLEAARLLPAGVTVRIVGEGPERGALEDAVAARGLGDRVELAGARTHAELPAEYAAADVVAVPSVRDRSGDRDGLPNVALEAMASGRPLVASAIGALPSAVLDGRTGILVPPGDAQALAGAIAGLAASPARRADLGRAARALAERSFALEACAARFLGFLEGAYA